jgi:hypothetical protein
MPYGQTEAAASSQQYNECICQSTFTPYHMDNTDYTAPQHLISSVEVHMHMRKKFISNKWAMRSTDWSEYPGNP